MKERGISFSTAMIAAYVAGLKTQTRRIIKPQPSGMASEFAYDPIGNTKTPWRARYPFKKIADKFYYEITDVYNCPYGQPEDILYTREEHLLTTDGESWRCEFKDGFVIYKQNSEIPADTLERLRARKTVGKWQRARFQPRIFSRADLVIKSIRVERLQDISEEDAKAEGITPLLASGMQIAMNGQLYQDYSKPVELFNDGLPPIDSYRTLWEKVNGPGSWRINHWVWVIEF